MKNNTSFTLRIATLVVLVSMMIQTSCKKDDPKPKQTEVERVTELLTSNGGQWAPSSSARIIVDGVDVTDELFAGFSITFAASTFTTSGESPVWLREDTWNFKDETATTIIRGQDEKEINITEVSDDEIILTMEWDQLTYEEEEGGRTKSIPGVYEFRLVK